MANPTEYTITVSSTGFSPDYLRVNKGDQVRFQTGDSCPHTLTISPGAPAIFAPPNNSITVTPASPTAYFTVSESAAKRDYKLTVSTIDNVPATGTIKVNN